MPTSGIKPLWDSCSFPDRKVIAMKTKPVARMRKAACLLICACALSLGMLLVPSQATVAYADEGVREIASTDDFLAFAKECKDAEGSKLADVDTVRLTADIDLSSVTDEQAAESFQKYSMFGSFSYNLDGGGHTISGIDRPFVYLSPDGENADYDSDGSYRSIWSSDRSVSLLKDVTIKNLTVKGDIDIDACGVFAWIASGVTFDDVANYVSLETSADPSRSSPTDLRIRENGVGGFVGTAADSSFTRCSYLGTLLHTPKPYNPNNAPDSVVAGICGQAEGTTVFRECINYGTATSSARDAAGINARQTKGGSYTYERCANKGSISNEKSTDTRNPASAAGIVAMENNSNGLAGITYVVKDCYNIGDITVGGGGSKTGGNSYAGGILSYHTQEVAATEELPINVSVSNCYNTGDITVSGGNAQTADQRKGDIYPASFYYTGTNYAGFKKVDFADLGRDYYYCTVDIGNNYGKDKLASLDDPVATLGDAYQADVNGVNPGKVPLLKFEPTENTIVFSLAFDVSGLPEGTNATVSLYSDEGKTQPIEALADGTFGVVSGKYWYVAHADGYTREVGSVSLYSNAVEKVKLQEAHAVSFDVSQGGAVYKVAKASGAAAYEPDSEGVYYIPKDSYFVYSATAEGCNGTQAMACADADKRIEVSLKSSDYGTLTKVSASSDGTAITSGGTYAVDLESPGTIDIATTQHVTLVGKGVGANDIASDIMVTCSKAGAFLTLKDLYLSHTGAKGNMVDFTGRDNTLEFAGTCIADKDTAGTGYAMFHVAKGDSLTVTGGTAYLYKNEQGAGFGGNGGADADKGGTGQKAEANGEITFRDATLYMKNTKQGASIGAGAQADKLEPDPINIYDSTLYLEANSRGSSIGGSAGSSGGSSGSTVTVRNSQVTINVDWSGAAIGGGGYGGGNDADGGTLVYKSGSIRTYIDWNAITGDNTDGSVTDGQNQWAWAGVTEPGVNNNAAITADVVGENGEQLYLAAVPVEEVEADSDGNYDIELDGESTLYHGALHQYKYINESLQKESQVSVASTMCNWVPDDDKTLYVYVPEGTHALFVNGVAFQTTASSDDKAATVKRAEVVDASGVKLAAKSVTYNGKAQSITATNVPTGVKVSYSGNGKRNAGSYTVKATLSCEDGYVFTDGTSSKDVTAKLTIKKASQTPKVAKTAKKVKRGKYSSKVKVTGAKGSVKYYKKSGSKYLSISKAGKVKVSKKAKKGKTYKIKVYVKAKSTANYKAATSKTVTIKVKVKK